MPPSRAEYLKLLDQQESKGRPYHTTLDTAMGMIKTAAVSFEHLTNTPEWDRFLSYAQAKLDEAKKERERFLSYCGGAVGDALIQSQLKYQSCDGYVRALEELMGLPNQLLQSYRDIKSHTEVVTQP